MSKQKIKQKGLSRIIALLLALIMFVPVVPGLVPWAAAADNAEENAGVYMAPEATPGLSIGSDGTLSVTGGAKLSGKVVIPEGVKTIPANAFRGQSSITEVVIPETVANIGTAAFFNCAGLKSVTIPGSVKTINERAFAGCSGLESLYILYGVHTIGANAFMNCKNLKNVAISPSVNELPDPDSSTIFDENASGIKLQANEDSAIYKHIQNIETAHKDFPVSTDPFDVDSPAVYDYKVTPDGAVIEGYFGESDTIEIPKEINGVPVTQIGDDAFNANKSDGQNTDVVSVSLPESLRTIGSNAFAGCDELLDIIIPKSVTGIGSNAFNGATKVTLLFENEGMYEEWKSRNLSIEFELWKPGTALHNELTVKVNMQGYSSLTVKRVGEDKPLISGTGVYKVRRNAELEINVVPIQRAANQSGYRFTGWKLATNYEIVDESAGKVNKELSTEELEELIDTPNLTRARLKMPSYPIILTATFAVIDKDPLYIRYVKDSGEIAEGEDVPENGNGGTVLESNTAKDEFEKYGIGVKIPEKHWDSETLKAEHTYNVTRIGSKNYNRGIVFLDTRMKHLVFGPNITEIQDRAFEEASGLESIEMSGGRDVTISKDNVMNVPNGLSVGAYFTCDGVLFQVLSAGSYELVAYPKNKQGAYTVPKGVTKLHYNAFQYCKGLTSINLNEVKEIDVGDSSSGYNSYAFYGCSKLTSADLGALKVLPRNAFGSCINLASVKCNAAETIGIEAFNNCWSLAEVDMPNVITIGNEAFYYCTALNKLTNMDKVVTIGEYAFSRTNLTAVKIPGSTVTVGNRAFYSTPLTEVTWGDNSHLKTIGSYAFASTQLEDVVLPKKVESTGSAGGGITIMSGAYANCKIQTVTLTAAINTLASDAFEGCTQLRSYALDESDTENITCMTINVKSGDSSQEQRMWYSKVSGYKYVVIDDVLFRYSNPQSVDVTKPQEAELILMSYPIQKTGASYVVPDKVTALDDSALYGAQFTAVDLNNVKTLGDKALAFSSITAIDFGNVEELGTNVLSCCDGLTMVGWPNSDAYKVIPEGTFSGSKNLRHVRIGANVTEIRAKAFANCTALTSVDMRGFDGANILETDGATPYKLPDAITKIGDYAFYQCAALEGIIFPEAAKTEGSKLSIGKYAFAYAFPQSSNVAITIPAHAVFEEDAYYHESCAFVSSGIKSLKCYTSKIPGDTFKQCSNLETAELASYKGDALQNDGVEEIGNEAFYGCVKLSSLETNATKIGEYAFYSCASIAKVNLPKVSTIKRYAFSGCKAIPELLVSSADSSKKVTLEEGAFYGCSKIGKLTLNNVAIGKSAFMNCSSIDAPTIKGVDTIGVSAFEGCLGMKTLDLGGENKVGTIGNYAFRNCTNLTNLSINAKTISTSSFQNCGNDAAALNLNLEGAETIGNLAFQDCNRLVTLELPSNLKELKDRAFTTCESLKSISVKDNATTAGGYFANDGVLYINISGKDGECELVQYPQDKENANNAAPATDSDNPEVAAVAEVPDNVNYTVDSANNKKVTQIHVYAFESNNHLESIKFAPTVKVFAHSLFYRSDKIKNIYILNNEDGPNKAASPEFTFYSAQKDEGIFYGVPNEVRKNIIVYGYSGTNTEMVCLKYRIFGIKFISLNDAPDGLEIRVWGANGEPANESTTEFFGEVINYNPTVTTSEDGKTSSFATDIVIPGVINESNKDNVKLVAPKDKAGAENIDFDKNRISGNTTITVTRIDSNAFGAHAADITSVSLPQTIREIGMGAFEGCEKISEIIIPESVETIEPYAFKGTGITTIKIPGNVRIMGSSEILNDETQTSGWVGAFSGAEQLRRIEVDPKNGVYKSIDGVLFTKNGEQDGQITLIEVPAALSAADSETPLAEYAIPEGTYSIGSNSFCANHNLTKVIIPNSVQDIAVEAFKGCFIAENGVASIEFDNAVNEPGDGLDIQNRAFADNPGLKTIELPWYVVRLGDDVFAGCDNITDFVISEGYQESFGDRKITTDDGVLYGFTDLVENGASTKNYALYKYPSGRVGNAYMISDEFDKGIPVRQIYKSAFQGNKYLKSVSLAELTQVVQDSAFENCENLEYIELKNATVIGPLAFAGTALGKPYEVSPNEKYSNPVYIPSTVSSVEREAFARCKNLTDVYVLNPSMAFEEDVFAGGNHEPAEGVESNLTIHGYANSTAKLYADKYKYKFEAIKGSPDFTAAINGNAGEWVSFVSGNVNDDGSLTAKAGEEIKLQLTRTKQMNVDGNTVDMILGEVKVVEKVQNIERIIYTFNINDILTPEEKEAQEEISVSDLLARLKDPLEVTFKMPSNNVTIEAVSTPAQEQSTMSVNEVTAPNLKTEEGKEETTEGKDEITGNKAPSTGGTITQVDKGSLDGQPGDDKEITTGSDEQTSGDKTGVSSDTGTSSGGSGSEGSSSGDSSSGSSSGDSSSSSGSGDSSSSSGSGSSSSSSSAPSSANSGGGSSNPAPSTPDTPSSPAGSDGPSL